MPFIIQHLIPETQNLVTVTENNSAQQALSLMIEHDFSQLPVTDGNQKLKGMVTSDSILRGVSNLKVIPEKLKVSHATTRAKAYREEDELFEVLRGLRDASAAPIVDKEGRVTAIITSYDTAEYFRRRAEDIMLAEDIEVTLKDLIESAHRNETGELDTDSLAQAIQSITPSGREYKNKFKSALLSYVAKTGGKAEPDNSVLDEVFKKYLEQPSTPRAFEELTLSDFIQMFRNLWQRHSADFKDLEWDSIQYLLNDVRQTRNAIAHFREVTPQQREKLKFCADFLDRHRSDTAIESPSIMHDTAVTAINSIDQLNNQLEEEPEANDSRYAPLAIWLQAKEPDRVTCTFKEVEAIIQDELPPSARQHRNWWANDTVSHVQSAQWLEVGWRVSSVNMSTERVVFSRMGDRQSAYIEFFNQLQAKLQSIQNLSVQPQNNPQGRNWLELAVSSKGDSSDEPSYINFAFTRRSRFRIDIYINEREQKQNKQIFDQLQDQKTEIEAEFGAALSWERLNHRHGSRIAYYRLNSSITDNTEALDTIQTWAIEMLPMFYAALSDRFIAAQKEFADEGGR